MRPHHATWPAAEPLEARRLLSNTISGTVFNDKNGNGIRDLGEPGLAQQRVFLDLDFDGQWQPQGEPAALTNSKGQYAFGNVDPGVYRVRQIVPIGYRQTAPAKGFRGVTVSGFDDVYASNDFAITATVVFRGTVFKDANRNRVKDPAERGLAGWRIYIDGNRNGRYDAGERVRVTDVGGNYRFGGLPAGTYVLRIVPQKGFTVTVPFGGVMTLHLHPGQSLSNRNFGVA